HARDREHRCTHHGDERSVAPVAQTTRVELPPGPEHEGRREQPPRDAPARGQNAIRQMHGRGLARHQQRRESEHKNGYFVVETGTAGEIRTGVPRTGAHALSRGWLRAGLLARAFSSFRCSASPLLPESPNGDAVAMRSGFALTVAVPRRSFTGFPKVPSRAPEDV